MNQQSTVSRLKQYLNEKGWTSYRLAKESNFPFSSLNSIFRHETEPTIPTLRKLCKGLSIPMSEFFKDDISQPISYSQEELKLLSLYRNMKRSDKHLLETYADLLLEQEQVSKTTSKL